MKPELFSAKGAFQHESGAALQKFKSLCTRALKAGFNPGDGSSWIGRESRFQHWNYWGYEPWGVAPGYTLNAAPLALNRPNET